MSAMQWGSKRIGGTNYSLAHLDPFTAVCQKSGGGAYRIRVEFGAHCFTEGWKAHHTPDLLFMDGSTKRAFCLHRYAHSLHLPAAVNRAIAGDVFNNGGRFNIGSTLPGIAGPYLIAFQLLKAKHKRYDMTMRIVSAHLRQNMNLNLPKAKFSVVANSVANGAKIRWK